MQATLTSPAGPTKSNSPSPDALVQGRRDSAPARANASAVLSEDLLQGKKTVEINHNGAIYRLQSTKLGKLILTK